MAWRTSLVLSSILMVLAGVRVYVVLHRHIPPEIEQPEVVRWLDEAGRFGNVLTWMSHQLGIEHATWPAKQVVNLGARLLFNGFGNPATNITIRYTSVDNVPVTIFIPDNVPTNCYVPTMVYFHGGGWTWFSVDVYAGFLGHFARTAKLQIVAVEYRKAPQHPFPAAYDDCLAVTLGLIKRAEDFRIEAEKLIVGGDGAGGNLAAAVAHTTKGKILMQVLLNPALQLLDFETPSYQDNADILPGLSSAYRNVYHWLSYAGIPTDYLQFALDNRHISSQIRNTAFSNYVNSEKYIPKYLEITKSKTKPMKGGANFIVSSAFEKIVSVPNLAPLMTVHVKGSPNVYIMTSHYDVNRDDGIMYATRLFEADVKVKLEHYRNAFHGFYMFSGYGPIKFEVGKQAMFDLADFIQSRYNDAQQKEETNNERKTERGEDSVKVEIDTRNQKT